MATPPASRRTAPPQRAIAAPGVMAPSTTGTRSGRESARGSSGIVRAAVKRRQGTRAAHPHGGAAESLAPTFSPCFPSFPLRRPLLSRASCVGKGQVLGLLQAGCGIFLWEVRAPSRDGTCASSISRPVARSHARVTRPSHREYTQQSPPYKCRSPSEIVLSSQCRWLYARRSLQTARVAEVGWAVLAGSHCSQEFAPHGRGRRGHSAPV